MGTIHRASQLKECSWENVEVGEEYGPVEGVVSDFDVMSHAYAVGDFGRSYFEDSTPFGGRIGHPTLLANDIRRLFFLRYDTTKSFAGDLHSRNEIRFLRPVYVGESVTIRGKNVEKYQRRGKNYRVLEGEVLGASRQPLVQMRAVETVGLYAESKVGQRTDGPSPDAITGEVPPGTPVVTRATRYVPDGAVLPSLTKETTLQQSIIFSGFPFGWAEGGAKAMYRCIHTNPEDAQRIGQPDVIVQGLMSKAYLSELCTNFFGPSWLTTGFISVAFIRPVIVRDTITASALVKRRVEEAGRIRLELDVWCKNQRGELITVGRASAQVE